LIHGWEGSIDSAYILSAGAMFFNHGYDVFRLNLRDHGNSHHLNRSLFNSTRLAEVVNALAEIHRLFPHDRTFLTGFSLGGNFALRVGLQAPAAGIKLTAIAVICPLINPVEATRNLEANHPVYHRYFVKKWQKSLRKKLAFHPDLGYGDTLLKLRSLTAMHDYFVPRHTDYHTTCDYLSAYRLSGEMLAKMQIPTHIIVSDDDPITSKSDIDLLGQPASVAINRTRYGGHCGYLKDLRLNSWSDEQLLRLFDQTFD
ncbi:MAG: alpha/beta fold hydrolase, partial [Proteobacteria bacterium]|nr:alpha/beta fold hydrolase [Pseudomonadota bacterium]